VTEVTITIATDRLSAMRENTVNAMIAVTQEEASIATCEAESESEFALPNRNVQPKVMTFRREAERKGRKERRRRERIM